MSEKSSTREIVIRIEQKLDTTHEWVKSHDIDIKALQADVNKAKGGWCAVLGLTSLAGAVGGFISRFIK